MAGTKIIPWQTMTVAYKDKPVFEPKTTSLVKALSYVDFGVVSLM